MIPIWRQPKAIDWEQVRPLPEGSFSVSQCGGDPCIAIASAFEARVCQHSKCPITPMQLGRSRTTSTSMQPAYSKPATPSRHGDAQPKYQGTSLRYNQWFKQLRRLEAYARGNHSSDITESQLAHKHHERRSILHAPGFPGGLQSWWQEFRFKPPIVPHQLPIHPLNGPAARSSSRYL